MSLAASIQVSRQNEFVYKNRVSGPNEFPRRNQVRRMNEFTPWNPVKPWNVYLLVLRFQLQWEVTVATKEYFTLGEVAKELGCQLWQVQRMFFLKRLPDPPRIARARVVTAKDILKIKEELIKAGYLKG